MKKDKEVKMLELTGKELSLCDLVELTRKGGQVTLSADSKERIKKAEKFVEKVVDEKRVVYGITTGFGKFSDVVISKEETAALQANLIMSHSSGVGEPLPEDVVLGIMLLRINNFANGKSGIRLSTVETLVEMVNKRVVPVIPEKGSLGASGDLAPLSHMVLVLIGMGEAFYQGERMSGADAMKKAGITPVVLTSKEGLALINGTQVMTSVGAHALSDAILLSKTADLATMLTAEALRGVIDAYDPRLHDARPHAGQIRTAKNLRYLLEGSKNVTRQGEIRVQDAYALRCVPQIHGASKDALDFIKTKVDIEMNAVTDNPLIFADDEEAYSGGNFHGQPMALPFDFLGIAVAELANVSERRIERLVNPALSGLNAFLTENGGLNSGFMIAQYSAASLVSENKVLAHPASVDSIPSSANQEDHVSMGTIAARKAASIVYNTSYVLAIELLCAAQAIDLEKSQEKLGRCAKKVYDAIRKIVPYMDKDRVLNVDIEAVRSLVMSGELLEDLEIE